MSTTISNIIFITLLTVSVMSQLPHTFWVSKAYAIDRKESIRNYKAVTFCLIVSGAIIAFALTGKHWYAIGFAILEAAFNLHYYNVAFELKKNKSKVHSLMYARFLAIVIPVMILIFSLEIKI